MAGKSVELYGHAVRSTLNRVEGEDKAVRGEQFQYLRRLFGSPVFGIWYPHVPWQVEVTPYAVLLSADTEHDVYHQTDLVAIMRGAGHVKRITNLFKRPESTSMLTLLGRMTPREYPVRTEVLDFRIDAVDPTRTMRTKKVRWKLHDQDVVGRVDMLSWGEGKHHYMYMSGITPHIPHIDRVEDMLWESRNGKFRYAFDLTRPISQTDGFRVWHTFGLDIGRWRPDVAAERFYKDFTQALVALPDGKPHEKGIIPW